MQTFTNLHFSNLQKSNLTSLMPCHGVPPRRSGGGAVDAAPATAPKDTTSREGTITTKDEGGGRKCRRKRRRGGNNLCVIVAIVLLWMPRRRVPAQGCLMVPIAYNYEPPPACHHRCRHQFQPPTLPGQCSCSRMPWRAIWWAGMAWTTTVMTGFPPATDQLF